jgi:hypothetical protein
VIIRFRSGIEGLALEAEPHFLRCLVRNHI